MDGCCDLGRLIANVENLDTTNQVKHGLLGKLREARKALDRGDTVVAVRKLEDFRDQVAGQAGNAISQFDAEYLDACAAQTIDRIEGPCH